MRRPHIYNYKIKISSKICNYFTLLSDAIIALDKYKSNYNCHICISFNYNYKITKTYISSNIPLFGLSKGSTKEFIIISDCGRFEFEPHLGIYDNFFRRYVSIKGEILQLKGCKNVNFDKDTQDRLNQFIKKNKKLFKSNKQ